MADTQTAKDRIAFLRALRAVRQFRPDPVPQDVVDDLLEVACWTGSARNRQPWELVVIRDRETLRTLAGLEGYAGHLAGAPLGIALGMSGKRPEHETYDEGRLSERIMLAASAHGVGSSIGWIIRDGRDTAREILGIPPERLVRTAISLGYPDEDPPLRGRSALPQGRKPLAAFSSMRSATAGTSVGVAVSLPSNPGSAVLVAGVLAASSGLVKEAVVDVKPRC